jgi:hypothetical protein
VVETNARALIEVLGGIPRNRHVCLEEGTFSERLHEVLARHVEELVVAGVRKSRGPKSDKRDAFGLAEQLRIGALERCTRGEGSFRGWASSRSRRGPWPSCCTRSPTRSRL